MSFVNEKWLEQIFDQVRNELFNPDVIDGPPVDGESVRAIVGLAMADMAEMYLKDERLQRRFVETFVAGYFYRDSLVEDEPQPAVSLDEGGNITVPVTISSTELTAMLQDWLRGRGHSDDHSS